MDFWGEFSWPEFVSVFPTYVAAIGTLGAVFVASVQIRAARREASERDALNSLNREVQSPDWQESRARFFQLAESLRNGSLDIDTFLQKRLGRGSGNEESDALVNSFHSTLNSYEVMAIGISTGAYSEEIYRRYFAPVLLKDWRNVQEIVDRIRQTEDDTVYEHVQRLAERWSMGIDASEVTVTKEIHEQSPSPD